MNRSLAASTFAAAGGNQIMSLTALSPVMLILIACLVLAIGLALWMYILKTRTQKLRSKFGPEYDKAVAEHKNRGHAESELQKRTERVARFHIQPLKAEDRSRFTEDWRREQSRFVDDPRAAVNHAEKRGSKRSAPHSQRLLPSC